MKLLVKKCCCCVELPTGAMILGWATMVFAMCSIFVSIAGIAYAELIAEHFHKEVLMKHTYTEEEIERIIVIVCSVFILGKLINVISAGLLLAGTVKHNRLMLVPWLFAEFCTTIIMLLFGALEFAQDIEESNNIFPNLIVNLILLGISIYFWICIYSFYRKLKEEETNTQRSVEQPPAYVATRFEKSSDPPYVTLT